MNEADKVSKYYDDKTGVYLKIYGNVIQAFRPSSEKNLLKYLKNSIGFKKNQKILDAGCGVAGPAIYFAGECKISIDGITVSEVQANYANQKIKEKKLDNRIKVIKGDYHDLDTYYAENSYDGVIFLESLGHAHNPVMVLEKAAKLIRTGGFIYIKDFFKKESGNVEYQKKVDVVIDRMNENYAYHTLKLIPVIEALRKGNFEIEFIKKFEFKDDTSIRAAFEKHEGMNIFEGYEEFCPAEWLEIKCSKFPV